MTYIIAYLLGMAAMTILYIMVSEIRDRKWYFNIFVILLWPIFILAGIFRIIMSF